VIQLLGEVHHYNLALQPVSHEYAARLCAFSCREVLALALLNQTVGAAMGAVERAGLTIIAAIFAGCALSAPPRSSPSGPPASTVASGFHDQALAPGEISHAPAVPANTAAFVEEWDAKSSPDLYGNEVSDAVARFKLDDAGSLYEVHSPQTELPHLASPIS